MYFLSDPRGQQLPLSRTLIFDEQPPLPLLPTVPLLLRASACGTCPCQAATFSIKFSQFSAAYSRATAYAINIMTNTSERDGKGDGDQDGDGSLCPPSLFCCLLCLLLYGAPTRRGRGGREG